MLLVGGVVLVLHVLRDNSRPQPHTITTVMRVVIPPPPPPPPTPPPPPPPPQQQKFVEQPKPTEQAPQKPAPKPIAKPANAAPSPPGNPLSAEAAPGPNPYGLQVGQGDGDVIGGGGGRGGDALGYYASLVKSQILAAVQRDDRARTGRYQMIVQVWMNASGQVTRARLVDKSGNEVTDNVISKLLGAISVGEAPPPNMPEPISMTIDNQS
jgi:periplasmic protein TonB